MVPFIECQASSFLRWISYFFIGGMAAFIATLPLQTALTFMLIDTERGYSDVQGYARGLLPSAAPWACYMATVILGAEKLGVLKSPAMGILVYISMSFLFRLL